MLHIVNALRRSPAVKQVQVIDLIDEATVRHLKRRAELVDGSTLHLNESSIIGKNKYSYHWQDAQNQLIIRWDNAPHHPHLTTFPHHRHEGGAVHENPRVSIDEVLAEIENRFRVKSVLP
ncbi:MAG: toxin-antitoxin system TumE family protein [bacterium]